MTEIRTRQDGLSAEQAAAELGVHPNTVYGWMRDGLLPYTVLGPTKTSPRRIKPEDLERFRHGGARAVDAATAVDPQAAELAAHIEHVVEDLELGRELAEHVRNLGRRLAARV